jgi:hypothetical protein
MTPRLSEKARQHEPFEWDAPVAVIFPSSTGHAVLRDVRPTPSSKVALASIRDRYIATRFPGLARCGEDLEDVGLVIGGARLYFDEGKTDRALELLDLAIEQCPFDEPCRLARLEVAFLLRDAPLYTALAEEFRKVRGAGIAWCEVARLGRALAPSEPIFGAKQANRSHEHYGPWPNTPNWIRASWDLTPEVLAADYHRLMARPVPPSPKRALRSVARKKR